MKTPAEYAAQIAVEVPQCCNCTGGQGFCTACIAEVAERVVGQVVADCAERARAFVRAGDICGRASCRTSITPEHVAEAVRGERTPQPAALLEELEADMADKHRAYLAALQAFNAALAQNDTATGSGLAVVLDPPWNKP